MKNMTFSLNDKNKKDIKLSDYVIFIPLYNKKWIIFNTLYNTLSTGDDELVMALNNKKFEDIPFEVRRSLIKAYVLVPKELNEKNMLKLRKIHHYIGQKEYVGLTLVMTYSCNLKCPYCYEGETKKLGGSFNSETLGSVLDFVNNIQVKENISNLKVGVTFYGGEPLLNLKGIEYFLKRLEELKEQKNLEGYSGGIITNGTLINTKVISILSEYPIGHIQVTLDGPKEIHDKSRIDKKGKGTFEKIITNIKSVIENINRENFTLGIRINVSKSNLPYIERLISYLSRELPRSKKVSINFGIIRQGINTCVDISDSCLTGDILRPTLFKLWSIAQKYGFKVYTRPYPRLSHCTYDALHGFVIDPYLNVYPCWEVVGIEEFSIGNISRDGEFIPKPLYYDTKTRNALEIPQCSECKLLPICMGGCPIEALKTTGSLNGPGCFPKKYEYDVGLLHYIMRQYPHVLNEDIIKKYLTNVEGINFYEVPKG